MSQDVEQPTSDVVTDTATATATASPQSRARGPHDKLKEWGERWKAMATIIGCVAAIFLAGISLAALGARYETKAHADSVQVRVEIVEQWQKDHSINTIWMCRSIEAIGRKVGADMPSCPATAKDR